MAEDIVNSVGGSKQEAQSKLSSNLTPFRPILEIEIEIRSGRQILGTDAWFNSVGQEE